MAGKTFKPKLISSVEARDAAGFECVLFDLEHIVACCNELLSRGEFITPFHHVARALCTSALINYRRCFNTGCRVSIKIDECNFLSAEDHEHHEFCLGLVDKHLAHSVNGYERANMTIHIAEDIVNGSLARGGLGSSSIYGMEFGFDDVRQLAQRIENIIVKFVKPRIEELKALVTLQVEKMSDDELRALPEGFVTHSGRGKVDKPRSSPYVSGAKKVNR